MSKKPEDKLFKTITCHVFCPFCSKSNHIEINKALLPEKKNCEFCGRMFIVLKEKSFFGIIKINIKVI
jgi:hypothetical protein